MRRLLIPAGMLLAISLTALGCGTSTKKSSSTAARPVSSAATVSSTATPIGTVLVDGSGRTLYMFEKDKPGASSCTGACAASWPPFVTGGSASAGTGVAAAKIGTIARADGTRQVVYNGHPLYRFASDPGAGSMKGQNVHAFGGDWYVVSTSGEEIDKPAPKPAASSGGSPSGAYPSSGGGY